GAAVSILPVVLLFMLTTANLIGRVAAATNWARPLRAAPVQRTASSPALHYALIAACVGGAVLLVAACVGIVVDSISLIGSISGILLGTLLGPARIAGVDFRQWFRDPRTP